MESGRLQPQLTQQPILPLVLDAIGDVEEGLQHQRSIHFDPGTLSPKVEADRELLSQALINLFANALKYSEGCPDPELSLFLENDTLVMVLEDYGVGIPKEEIKGIFEPFVRGSNVTGDTTGSGLGLNIARLIIEGHHGELDLQSDINQGTKIILRLPVV
jgi:signal transduction histidine kinase